MRPTSNVLVTRIPQQLGELNLVICLIMSHVNLNP